MFNKLRNKFLILNMAIISIVMLTSFLIIYSSTYTNIKKDNQDKLDSIFYRPFGAMINNKIENNNLEEKTIVAGVIPDDFFLSFIILTNDNGDIIEISSYIDMPLETYNQMAKKAFNNLKNYSTIKINNKEWMYKVEKIGIGPILRSNNKIINTDNTFYIAYLDITDSKITLTRLFITFLIVGILTLFVIYFISLYFANKAITPIIKTWNKQKQFIADASHELKTPLTIINANTEALLLNKKNTIKNQEKWINYIQTETNRMNKLVHDLLFLAQTENTDITLEHLTYDISDVLNTVILSLEAIIFEKNIKLNHNIEENIIIKGDADKIKQVMLILIDNAIKYTDDKGEININLKRNNKQIIFTIENTGKGINESDLPKVFDRFYRVDAARNSSDNSYGLGLPIAASIIDRMGGKINVKSIEGKSTIFTIILKTK